MNGLRRWAGTLWPPISENSLRLHRHCLPLDGVRGLAVLLVLCYDCLKLAPNSNPLTLLVRKISSSGWIGVNLFFVLSGFLITGILLDTRGRPGYWRSFFLRRAVRIFPLYYVTLLGILLLGPTIVNRLNASSTTLAGLHDFQANQLWYWLYAQNWLFAWQQAWPVGIPVKHFWSLAIEEQFYLVWPLIVAFLTRRQLGWLCACLCVLSLSSRVCLLNHGVPPMVVFLMTITRLDGLCSGALMAIALRTPQVRDKLAGWLPLLAVSSLAILAGVDLATPILLSETWPAYSFGHFAVAISFALLIGAAACVSPSHLIGRVFSVSGLTILGKYSYGIYVFHRFVYQGVLLFDWTGIPEQWRGWLIFICSLGGSLLAAQASWLLLERPCLSLKKYFPRPDEVKTLPAGTVNEGRRINHLSV